jgi:hypothetical protein
VFYDFFTPIVRNIEFETLILNLDFRYGYEADPNEPIEPCFQMTAIWERAGMN